MNKILCCFRDSNMDSFKISSFVKCYFVSVSCFIFLGSQQFCNGRYYSVIFLNMFIQSLSLKFTIRLQILGPLLWCWPPILQFFSDFLFHIWYSEFSLKSIMYSFWHCSFRKIIYLTFKIIPFCGTAKNYSVILGIIILANSQPFFQTFVRVIELLNNSLVF